VSSVGVSERPQSGQYNSGAFAVRISILLSIRFSYRMKVIREALRIE